MRTDHDVLMEDPKFREAFAIESAVAGAAELIAKSMDERGLSKSDLAKRLGKSRSWVTQLLSGESNVTIRTLAQVLHFLGQELQFVSAGAEPSRRNKTPNGPKRASLHKKARVRIPIQLSGKRKSIHP